MSDNIPDICVICQEDLSTNPVFELLDCKHSFHQRCINAWFRQGNAKCPLCNSCGHNCQDPCRGWPWHMARFSQLRRASRRKNAPSVLVKGIAQIKKKERLIAELKAEMQGWKEKDIILDGEQMKIKEAIARYKKISTKYRQKVWQLRRAKVTFAQRQNLIPIILVERRIID